jgi:predicted nucleotidyltransferase
MTPFELTLKNIDEFCAKHKISYSIIGGIALISYKIQRTTNDVDVTLLIDLDKINDIGEKIISNFEPLFSDSIMFFQKNFVLPVIDKSTNIRIDFAAGLTEFDKKVIQRSTRKEFGKINLPFCSLEDLILYKLFAFRPRDVSDLHEISKKYKNVLDKKYLSLLLNDFTELDRDDMKENFKKIF